MRTESRFSDLPPLGPQVDPAARTFTIEPTPYDGMRNTFLGPGAGGRKQWR
jgi:hypothetical protein